MQTMPLPLAPAPSVAVLRDVSILSLGNIWYSIDSFCEYADTLHTKTLIKGIFFFSMIFWFAGRAITEYKLQKAKQNALTQK